MFFSSATLAHTPSQMAQGVSKVRVRARESEGLEIMVMVRRLEYWYRAMWLYRTVRGMGGERENQERKETSDQ